MRLSTKIAYNTIIQVLGKVISTILALLTIAIITRELGQTGFGEYTTIMTFVSFFAIAADLGLTLITVQQISQPNADEKYILGNLFSLRLLSAIFILGIAPLAVLFFPYDNIIKIGVLISSFSFLFIALNQILVGLFQKKLRMDKVTIAEIISRLFLFFGALLAFKLGYKLISIIFITALSSFINFIFHYYFSQKYTRIKLLFDFAYWKKIILISWPLALTITLNLIYLKTDTLLLSLIQRPSTIGILAEVGLYGAAYKVIDVLITFPFMFAGIILPILTAVWAEKDLINFKKILQKSFDALALIIVPIIIGAQFTAGKIMDVVAGESFFDSGKILQILILACGMIFMGNILAHTIIVIEKQKNIIGAYFFTAITSVIGYFLFIPKYSYYAAAWVTVYSESVIAIASGYLVWKYSRFIPNFKITVKSFLSSLPMAIFLFLNQTKSVYFLIPVSIVIYLLFIYITRAITKEEIFEILNIKKNEKPAN